MYDKIIGIISSPELKAITINVIPAIILLLLGLFIWLYQKEREKRIAIEHQLSDKKYDFYVELLNFFFDTIQNKNQSIDGIKEKLWKFNKNLYLYSSDEVLNNYKDWSYDSRKNSENPNYLNQMLQGVCKIIISIRKDMGHKKTNIKGDDILKHLLTDYDNAKREGLIK